MLIIGGVDDEGDDVAEDDPDDDDVKQPTLELLIMLIIGGVDDEGDDVAEDDPDDDDVKQPTLESKLRTGRDRTIVCGVAAAPTGCILIVKTKEELKFSSLLV
ncbi:hypothetical protein F2Q69_00044896 [Brassica cretica]|uniref:Uncharacterized protein n=1 Tax=Brassica cretica TaxID=69181 RepID=A0A8S9NVK0_BRACR|nr:hypothetical protein F2Q69_00044896 [Brassica cretica]